MIVNYYRLLGVDTDATPAEIAAAYRRVIRSVHPDVAPPNLQHLANDVNEAFQVLSDPVKRELYDRELLLGRVAADEPDPVVNDPIPLFPEQVGDRKRDTFTWLSSPPVRQPLSVSGKITAPVLVVLGLFFAGFGWVSGFDSFTVVHVALFMSAVTLSVLVVPVWQVRNVRVPWKLYGWVIGLIAGFVALSALPGFRVAPVVVAFQLAAMVLFVVSGFLLRAVRKRYVDFSDAKLWHVYIRSLDFCEVADLISVDAVAANTVGDAAVVMGQSLLSGTEVEVRVWSPKGDLHNKVVALGHTGRVLMSASDGLLYSWLRVQSKAQQAIRFAS